MHRISQVWVAENKPKIYWEDEVFEENTDKYAQNKPSLSNREKAKNSLEKMNQLRKADKY